MNSVAVKRVWGVLEVRETAFVLAVSVALPFTIHLLPAIAARPVGAMLLPMFYAPLIAVILFRPHVAIITGLLSPLLNSRLTGHPLPEMAGLLTFELVLFSVIALLIQRRWKSFPGSAVFAYLAAVLSAAAIFHFQPWNIITVALPGLTVLFLINKFLLKIQSRDNDDRGKFSGNPQGIK
jgi:hypothetical protein